MPVPAQVLNKMRVLVDKRNKWSTMVPMSTAQQYIATARTILDQIGGGNRVRVMTGATSFDALDNGLYIKLPRRRNVKIELNGQDTYDLTFTVVGNNYEIKSQTKESDIYADQLIESLERLTGLYWRL